jgi:prepilin-type processing-associated H-X9-DG protein
VFGGPNVNGLMGGNNVEQFKSTMISRPSDTVAICDISGSNDPSHIGGDADAAWLDTVWAGFSGPTAAITGFNGRLQTAHAKHNSRVNVIYVDGHAAPSLPSKLVWAQFWGIFDTTVALKDSSGGSKRPFDPISTAAYDHLEWSAAQE